MLVDYNTLLLLKGKYTLEKNERLKKYEIRMGQFDVDIYLPGYSALELPVESLLKDTTKIENITVVRPEQLVILKQGAEIARRGSIKGRKDAIDIPSSIS